MKGKKKILKQRVEQLEKDSFWKSVFMIVLVFGITASALMNINFTSDSFEILYQGEMNIIEGMEMLNENQVGLFDEYESLYENVGLIFLILSGEGNVTVDGNMIEVDIDVNEIGSCEITVEEAIEEEVKKLSNL